MLLPLLVAVFAVLLGAALGLSVGERALGPARLVAVLASLIAVFAQLIPEAVHDLGWWALIGVAVAAAVPLAADLLGRSARASFSLEIAYGGMLVHQLADGVALGSLAAVDHDHGHEVSFLAIAAHTVALAALFVLLYRERQGRLHALLRGAGMALALIVGALVVSGLPSAWVELAHPWVVAVAAGVLLHVALHPLVGLVGHKARSPELTGEASARRP